MHNTIKLNILLKEFSIIKIIILINLFIFLLACSNDDDPTGNNGIPTIIIIEPNEGSPGETIRVKGSNFAMYPPDNQFFFNGIPAEIYVGIPDELLVKVPVEASTGPVSLLVPGFDTLMGPVFTVRRIASVTRTSVYYSGGFSIDRATFDQSGNISIENIISNDTSGLALGALEVDLIGQKIYIVDEKPAEPAVYRVNFDGSSFEVLYDTSDVVFAPSSSEIKQLRRITLDLEENQLYMTDRAGRIIRGNMDGNGPLEVLYDDGAGNNTNPFGMSLAIGDEYIYWTEIVSQRILRVPRDGSSSAVVLYDASNGILSPREIVINEQENRLIISEDPFLQNGENIDRIVTGSLDGSSELEVMLEGDQDIVVNPRFGLALDVTNNLLYWAGQAFAGSNDRVLVRADLSQVEPNVDIIADQNDIPGFNHFTIVVTEQGANGRLRARIGR